MERKRKSVKKPVRLQIEDTKSMRSAEYGEVSIKFSLQVRTEIDAPGLPLIAGDVFEQGVRSMVLEMNKRLRERREALGSPESEKEGAEASI